MPPFQPYVKPYQIDDFLLGVMHKMQKEDPWDIITPRYPLFRRLESNAIRGVIEENPGHGPVRDVYYKTEDRYIELSKGQQMQPRDLRPQEHFTRAQYDWVMLINSLLITKYEWENLNTPEELVNVIARKKKGTDKSHRNRQVSWLWNGRTVGGMKLWGIKDVIRADTTTDPARGPVGEIPVANVPEWAPKVRNFNGNFMTYVSGAQSQSFLSTGPNSLLQLFSDLGYFGENEEGEELNPDLVLANSVYWRVCHHLVENKMMFYDEGAEKELGVTGLRFQSATIIEDRNVPDDPNNAAYGSAIIWNSNFVDWVYTKGIRNRWSKMTELPVDTAYAFDKTTQACIAWKALNRFGWHYGVNPTISAT